LNANSGDATVTIRGYQPPDLEACRGLWAELTEWHRSVYQSHSLGGPDPGRHFDRHLERVGPRHLWVAEVGGQVVGLAGLIVEEEEAELEPLIVSPANRGRGIGRRLVQAVFEAARAKGMGQISVRPVARNDRAIRYFHSLGFDVLGRVEMFTDLAPPERQIWKPGEQLAGRGFRV
jgi:GNAT superfamily N-acetyltransferase